MATTRIIRRELRCENIVAADRAAAEASAEVTIIARAESQAPFSYADLKDANAEQRLGQVLAEAQFDTAGLRLQVIRFLVERHAAADLGWGWGDVAEVEARFGALIAAWQDEQRALATLEIADAAHDAAIAYACTPEEEKELREAHLIKADVYVARRTAREQAEQATYLLLNQHPITPPCGTACHQPETLTLCGLTLCGSCYRAPFTPDHPQSPLARDDRGAPKPLAQLCEVCHKRPASLTRKGDAVCTVCAGLYPRDTLVPIIDDDDDGELLGYARDAAAAAETRRAMTTAMLPPDAMLVNNKILTGQIIADLLYTNNQTRAALLALYATMTRDEVRSTIRLLIRYRQGQERRDGLEAAA